MYMEQCIEYSIATDTENENIGNLGEESYE